MSTTLKKLHYFKFRRDFITYNQINLRSKEKLVIIASETEENEDSR